MAPWLIGWALLLCAQVIITSGPTGSGKSLLASTVATRIGAVDILDADGKARVAPPQRCPTAASRLKYARRGLDCQRARARG